MSHRAIRQELVKVGEHWGGDLKLTYVYQCKFDLRCVINFRVKWTWCLVISIPHPFDRHHSLCALFSSLIFSQPSFATAV